MVLGAARRCRRCAESLVGVWIPHLYRSGFMERRPSNPLSIREMPRTDRPRERLVDLGVQALSTAELLAILLGTGGPERSALHLGQAVFTSCGGSLRRIARD